MIKVGVPEWHGMIEEQSRNAPQGYSYRPVESVPSFYSKIFKSPIKGGFFKTPIGDFDIIEALVLPVVTDKPWVYSVAHFAEAMAFGARGVPLPKSVRRLILNTIFKRPNLLGISLWSHAALETMSGYAEFDDYDIITKAEVVYPSVGLRPTRHDIPCCPTILFNGQFFRKGGMHVVDAFERLKPLIPNLRMFILSDPNLDFVVHDAGLRQLYLNKLKNLKDVFIGRVDSRRLHSEIFPQTSVYVLPTYEEAFGFAALEAISHGVPVVASDIFALPEIVSDGRSGLLLPYKDNVDARKIVQGYGIVPLSVDLHLMISEWVHDAIFKILNSRDLQLNMAMAGQLDARTKFSSSERNAKMVRIYKSG